MITQDVFMAFVTAYADEEEGALKAFLLDDLHIAGRLLALFAPGTTASDAVRAASFIGRGGGGRGS